MRSSSENVARQRNPRAGANFLSVITFWFSIKTFYRSRKKDLDEEDLPECLDEHRSDLLGQKIAVNWSKEYEKALKKKKKPSLTKVIIKTFHCDFFIYGLIIFIMEMCVRLIQPLFIGLFIRYFNPNNRNSKEPVQPPTYFNRLLSFGSPQGPIQRSEAYFFAGCVMLCSCIIVMTTHPFMMGCLHMGMKIRVAVCSLIYRKALRIKLTSLDGQIVGNSINLMSNDVNRFDTSIIFIHYLWIAPIQTCFIAYFMYREVAVSAVLGMIAIAFAIPVQVILGLRTSTLREKAAIRTDNRVRQMNEIIQSMQVIKMYAWEKTFGKLIHKLRE